MNVVPFFVKTWFDFSCAGMPMPHAVGVVEVILLILSSSVAHGAWLLAACAGMSAGRGYGNEECQDCAPRLFY